MFIRSKRWVNPSYGIIGPRDVLLNVLEIESAASAIEEKKVVGTKVLMRNRREYTLDVAFDKFVQQVLAATRHEFHDPLFTDPAWGLADGDHDQGGDVPADAGGGVREPPADVE